MPIRRSAFLDGVALEIFHRDLQVLGPAGGEDERLLREGVNQFQFFRVQCHAGNERALDAFFLQPVA